MDSSTQKTPIYTTPVYTLSIYIIKLEIQKTTFWAYGPTWGGSSGPRDSKIVLKPSEMNYLTQKTPIHYRNPL